MFYNLAHVFHAPSKINLAMSPSTSDQHQMAMIHKQNKDAYKMKTMAQQSSSFKQASMTGHQKLCKYIY